MLLFTDCNTLVLWRKSPAPSAKNGATCYPEASDWNYINNTKARVKRCVFCMTIKYVVAFNRLLLSFPVKRQKIQIFASSTQPQGKVSQLSTQARQKWQLSCWGSSAQKSWLLPQPIWKWATKKRLATTSVYYVTRGGRNEAKSLLWTTPDWLRSEGDTVGIAMVGESKLAKRRNWSKKILTFQERQIVNSWLKEQTNKL